jgi:phenylalanyl-tRNA synthetase beta chain
MPRREEDVDQPVHEELWVGIVLTGLRQARAWHAGRERVDVYDAKGMAELVLAAAGSRECEATTWAEAAFPLHLERGRGGHLVAGGRDVGSFGELALSAREAFDLPAPVFVAELSLTALLGLEPWTPRYQTLPRYPAVQRDLALVVADDVTAGEIEAAIRGLRLPLLTRVALFDVYTGEQVGGGRRSLAWSLTFQATDRTLRDSEVNELHARIVEELTRRFNVEIRST